MSQAPRSALMLVLLAGTAGCGGDKATKKVPKGAVTVVSADLAAKMWPVRLSDDAARAPYEADQGWMHLFERSYDKALSAFKSSGNAAGLARVHQEYAAVYRQGALVAANATHHAYGQERAATDPVALQYMVGVAETMRGASGQLALAESASVPGLTKHVQAWSSNTMGVGGPAPTDLEWYEARTGAMGAVSVGARPTVSPLPHYQFSEKTAQAALVSANDPSLLLGLSQWHLAASRAALADSE